MIGGSLLRRLERLEQHIMPEDEPRVWEIIIVDSDGTRTPTGERIEMPSSCWRRGFEGADIVVATSLSNET